MNLKNAFRYQKFLDSLMEDGESKLTEENMLKITKEHMKQAVNPEAEDLTEEIKSNLPFSADNILSFLFSLVDEKEALSKAITEAKDELAISLDAEIMTNNFRRNLIKDLSFKLKFFKAKETEATGKDYKFNVDGDQVSYFYKIKATYEEAFDRKKIKNELAKLIKLADETSTKIDEAMLRADVKYIPKYDVNSSFEDAMEIFENINKQNV